MTYSMLNRVRQPLKYIKYSYYMFDIKFFKNAKKKEQNELQYFTYPKC